MRPRWTRACVALFAVTCVFAPAALAAAFDDGVPLVNWTAPPYWSAPRSESPASGAKHLLAISNPALAFHAVTPCRIADTRGFGFTGPYGPPSLTAGAPRSFAVTSPGTSCGIPSGVAAVSFNFAATSLTANGNLVAYPTGAAAPTVSSLNWTPSEVAISNAAVIALASDSITVLVNGPVGSTADLIIDVNGYYAADPVVMSLNGISGVVSLVASGDVTVTPSAPSITIGTNAVSANTANTLVRRDGSGNFAAGTITATLNGNSGGFTGSLAGDVTGTQGATVVSSVGGSSAANVHAAELLANAATSSNTANAIVRRDGSADFTAHTVRSTFGFGQSGTGGEVLRTVRGIIHGSDGGIFAGSGFTVSRTGAGTFRVFFTSQFSVVSIPAVTVTPIHGAGLYSFITFVGGDEFDVSFVSPTGIPTDPLYFNFIAIGVPF